MAIVVASTGVVLGAPRAAEPFEVPLPVANEQALRRVRDDDAARARQLAAASEAEKGGQGYELRRLGEALRAYNLADAARDDAAVAAARDELTPLTHEVRRAGVESLLRLRAFHLEVFLRELGRWGATGEVSGELREVGGDFVGLAGRVGWVRGARTLPAGASARAAMFKRRFNEVLSLREAAFALTLDETRALYAFLLAHPVRSTEGAQGDRETWVWTLRKVDELALVDPAYPAELARGVVQYRLGDGRSAVLSFRDHLAKHQDGPYTLRARNYLVAALDLAGD